MSTAQDNRNATDNFARRAAAILFVLLVGMGYAMSPQVEGAVGARVAAEDQGVTEPGFLPSNCAVDGLVFSGCTFDF